MVVNYNVSPPYMLRTKYVSSPREAFILWQPPCVRDWSGILLERSGKRYSGKPDGDSRNAQNNAQLTINNVQLTTDGLISALILAIREASKIISRKIRAHSWITFISVNFVSIRGQKHFAENSRPFVDIVDLKKSVDYRP